MEYYYKVKAKKFESGKFSFNSDDRIGKLRIFAHDCEVPVEIYYKLVDVILGVSESEIKIYLSNHKTITPFVFDDSKQGSYAEFIMNIYDEKIEYSKDDNYTINLSDITPRNYTTLEEINNLISEEPKEQKKLIRKI